VFRFPLTNKALLDKWLLAVRRQNWKPTKHSVLCSEHFESSCFRFYANQKRLKEDAVPSVFKFPEHLMPKPKTPRRTLVRSVAVDGQVENVCSESASVEVATPVSEPVVVLTDHNYSLLSSPSRIKRKYDALLDREKQHNAGIRKRLKVVRRKLFRQQAKMKSMKDVIQQLKAKTDVNSAAIDLIQGCFGDIPAEMLKRKLYGKPKEAYSGVLRSFAMTLHFYSAKAYNFIRGSFRQTLPHPSTLRAWCTSVEGKPGFTQEAFEVGT